MNGAQNLDREIYDDEAFIGAEEGEVMDGKVVHDLDDDDAEEYEEDEDESDDDKQAMDTDAGPSSADRDRKIELATVSEDAANQQADGGAEQQAEPLPDASLHCLQSHSDAVMAAAWSPDGQQIASGGCDDFGYLHRWRDGGAATQLAGHEDTVAAVAFDPSGATLATGGLEGGVRLWDTSSGGFTPDGRTVVTAGGDADGSIRTWNPRTGESTAVIPSGHMGHSAAGATCLAFCADSTLVVTGGVDGSIVLSNVATGKAVAQVLEHTESVEGVAFAATLPLVVSASMDGTAIVWDQSSGARRGTCAHPAGVVAVAMQHKGPLFATACLDGAVRVFDMRNAQLVATLGGHMAAVQSLAWSPDDAHIASGGDDHTVRVFAA